MIASRRIDAALATATVMTAVLFYATAFAIFGLNDFMYATAPIFWDRLPLYRDLMFVQAPGSIIIYGLIYRLVDPADFYVALRVFSLAILLLGSLLTYGIARSLAGRMPAILALAFLYTSPFVASVALDSGSTPLALLFLLCAAHVYVTRPASVRSAAAIGLSIGLAASMKLNFALYAIPFGLFIAYRAGLRSREVPTYIASGLIGSSAIWYYICTDFSHFWFFNIQFHALMDIARVAKGESVAGLVAAGAILFILYAAPALYFGYRAATETRAPEERRRLIELGMLLVTSLAAAFAPLYYAPQYLAAPVFILSICFPHALSILVRPEGPSRRHAWRFAWIIVSAWIALFWVQNLPPGVKALASENASFSSISRMRHRIDGIAGSYLGGTRCTMTAISLSPVPLLGSAFKISPTSASGPFLPIIGAQIRKRAPAFSRYRLTPDDLRRAHPTAFLIGYFPDIGAERMLAAYARENGFAAFDVGTLPGTRPKHPTPRLRLLVRRSCMTRPPPAS